MYNPSRRRNPKLRIKQIQKGILEYEDEIGKVLIGIETRELHSSLLGPDDVRKPHELCGVQWGITSGPFRIGKDVSLCPRDVYIFKELIKYLEHQGILIGDSVRKKRRRIK